MSDAILIMGAGGRLGYAAGEAFRDAGWHVKSLVRPGKAAWAPPKTEVVEVVTRDSAVEAARACAVVLNAQPAPANSVDESVTDEPSKATLKAEEQEKLQKELTRWRELKQEERTRIENRLKELEPSEEREQLINEYGKQVLGLAK